jgi:hypothetical protein
MAPVDGVVEGSRKLGSSCIELSACSSKRWDLHVHVFEKWRLVQSRALLPVGVNRDSI